VISLTNIASVMPESSKSYIATVKNVSE